MLYSNIFELLQWLSVVFLWLTSSEFEMCCSSEHLPVLLPGCSPDLLKLCVLSEGLCELPRPHRRQQVVDQPAENRRSWVSVWCHRSTPVRFWMPVLLTRGGLDLCLLGPAQLRLERRHPPTGSPPTCSRTGGESEAQRRSKGVLRTAAASHRERITLDSYCINVQITRIFWGPCSPSAPLPGSSLLWMWCHWLPGWGWWVWGGSLRLWRKPLHPRPQCYSPTS